MRAVKGALPGKRLVAAKDRKRTLRSVRASKARECAESRDRENEAPMLPGYNRLTFVAVLSV